MADAPWWTGFFDRAYTDAWTRAGAFDATAEHVPLLQQFISVAPGRRVLDIPCGFGRFAGPLHDAGFEVVGVDASPDQIALAHERNPGPDYAVGDMRQPPAGPFDVVMNLYSSFGYFDEPDDDLACLRAWHDVLVPGGIVVIEGNHRDRLALAFGEDWDGGELKETGVTDWVTGVRTSKVVVDGRERTFRVRIYSATELVALLAKAGFVDVEVFGGLDEATFDPSTRLVVRARRP